MPWMPPLRRKGLSVTQSENAFLERFKAVTAECLDVEPAALSDDARFKEDLNADSLDMAELGFAIEEAFAVTVRDVEVTRLETVGQAVDYLRRLVET